MGERESKVCRVCVRRFSWRTKWADNWSAVRHCSRRCRTRGLRPVDRALEEAIESLLAERPDARTICPSEAARRVDPTDWRSLMEPARMAARRLWHADRVRILQRNQSIDPDAMRGPVRLARAKGGGLGRR
jgi:hypothetical protein